MSSTRSRLSRLLLPILYVTLACVDITLVAVVTFTLFVWIHEVGAALNRDSELIIRGDASVPIVVNLDVVLAQRKMRSNELAERVGITPQNISVLKAGRAKAIRFETLEKICDALDCQPGDILEHRK